MNDEQDASVTQLNQSLICRGAWTLNHLNQVLKTHVKACAAEIELAGEEIVAMDSAGAWILWKLLEKLKKQGTKIKFSGFKPEYESLLKLIASETEKLSEEVPHSHRPLVLEQVGIETVQKFYQLSGFITFFGEITVNLWKNLRRPRLMQWQSLLHIIDETGYDALPIVGLLCFLIGIVLAYQGAQQLRNYGADAYIVTVLGVGMLQEFGPLITAIIVAGRTSSAFTAQIGTMQLNEEIDALRTMGLSPVIRLVLPKIFGVMIAMPLLILWADIFGLIGGMIVTKHMLGMSMYSFISRFPHVIQLSTFVYGLIKAPVFALIIASVGCFQGFRVSGTADSVGQRTTQSVVQSIFLIIIADAIFSIILPWQNF